MKQLFLTFILLCVSVCSSAQKQSRLYLKNGSIINGNIEELYPDSILKIRTHDGSLFVYKMDEVLKSEMTQNSDESWKVADEKGKYSLHKGYRGFAELGGGVNIDYKFTGFFNTSHGYQFNTNLFAGGGVGFHMGDYTYMVPIYAMCQYNSGEKNGIYVSAKLGVDINGYGDKNFYASPSAGYRFAIKKTIGLNVGLTFNYYGDHDGCYAWGGVVGIDF